MYNTYRTCPGHTGTDLGRAAGRDLFRRRQPCDLRSVRSCSTHARVSEGVAKSQFPLKAVVFKSGYRVLTRFLYTWTPSCTLAWTLLPSLSTEPAFDGTPVIFFFFCFGSSFLLPPSSSTREGCGGLLKTRGVV